MGAIKSRLGPLKGHDLASTEPSLGQRKSTPKDLRLARGPLSHPVLEGKPNANYVRARIRTHVHNDYINEHHHTMLE
jgi:hypothetical protein